MKLEYKFATVHEKKVVNDHVHKICEDETLKQIMVEYDDRGIKKSSRIINYLIRHQKYSLLQFTMNFKNTFNI